MSFLGITRAGPAFLRSSVVASRSRLLRRNTLKLSHPTYNKLTARCSKLAAENGLGKPASANMQTSQLHTLARRICQNPVLSAVKNGTIFTSLFPYARSIGARQNFATQVPTKTFEEEYQACQKALKDNKWDLIVARKDKLNQLVNEKGLSLLLEAIARQHLPLAEKLAENGLGLLIRDKEGNSALHHAARGGDPALIHKLCISGLKVDELNNLGQTPLHSAVGNRRVINIRSLLNEQALIDATCRFRFRDAVFDQVTPLHIAVINGDIPSFDELMSNKPNLEYQMLTVGNLLHIAIHFRHFEMLSHLLNRYFKLMSRFIEMPNDQGKTPLMEAAWLGEFRVVKLLQAKGADLNAVGTLRRTALHCAVPAMQHKIVHFLFSMGCERNPRDQNGNYPKDLLPKTDQGKMFENFLNNLGLKADLKDKLPPFSYYYYPYALVCKGGGPKGLAYVGAIEVLEAEGALRELIRVAGTSAGAIQAALLAFCYDTKAMKKELQTDFSIFLDHPLTAKRLKDAVVGDSAISTLSNIYSGCKAIYNGIAHPMESAKAILEKLWKTTGICEGKEFLNWMDELIERQTGKKLYTFGMLREDIQKGANFRHLHVVTTNLSTNELCHISSEDPIWSDVIISDAIRASMSIPGIFKPYILNKNKDGKRVLCRELGTHVDGGIISNFSIGIYDKRRYLSSNPSGEDRDKHVINPMTLGLSLFSTTPPKIVDKPIETVKDLLLGIFNIFYECENIMQRENRENEDRTISIDDLGVGLTEFNLSMERKMALMESGRSATLKFIESKKAKGSIDDPKVHVSSSIRVPQVHKHFTGRDAVIGDLEKCLLGQKKKQVVLYGPPGIGKTEAALAFANKRANDFSLIAYIENDNSHKAYETYVEIANFLEIEIDPKLSFQHVRSKVHDYLERNKFAKPFLFIFESDNYEMEIPKGDEGKVIILSIRQSPVFENIKISEYSKEEGKNYIKKILNRALEKDIEELVRQIGGFPLALAQTAAYISSTPGMNITKYLALNEQVILKILQSDSHYPKTFLAGWKIIQSELQNRHPEALEWLKICAFFQSKFIPSFWLDLWLEAKIVNSDDRIIVKGNILRTLRDYGMIRYNTHKDTLSMNPLLQVIIRQDSHQDESEINAIELINKAGKFYWLTHSSIIKMDMALWEPHAKRLLESSVISQPLKLGIVTFLAKWALTKRNFVEAVKYFEMVIVIEKANSNLSFAILGHGFYGKGYSLYHLKQYENAVYCLTQAIDLWSKSQKIDQALIQEAKKELILWKREGQAADSLLSRVAQKLGF